MDDDFVEIEKTIENAHTITRDHISAVGRKLLNLQTEAMQKLIKQAREDIVRDLAEKMQALAIPPNTAGGQRNSTELPDVR